MAKKKMRKASGGEWRPAWTTETSGNQPELRGLGFRLAAVNREQENPEDTFGAACRTVLPALLNLLGDHMVEVELGKPKPEVWKSGFEFRQQQYSQSVELKLSELVRPETWARMRKLFDGGIGTMRASRGGGSSRHEVWSIDVSPHMFFVDAHEFNRLVWTLTVAAEHVEPAQQDNWQESAEAHQIHAIGARDRDKCWQGLIETFFETADKFPGFLRGEGGLVRLESRGTTAGDRVALCSSDERMLAALRVLLGGDELSVVLPTAVTVLGPEQCKRLGGAEAIVAKARMEEAAYTEQSDWGLRVTKLGSSVLLQFSDVNDWVYGNDRCTDRPSMAWVLSLLHGGGLLAQAGPQVTADAEKYSAWKRSRLRGQDDVGADASGLNAMENSSRSAKMTLPKGRPSIVRSERSVIEDCPDDEFVRENVVCWRVRPREGAVDAGLTVYARHSAELGRLIAPALVGSLDAERAALAFHPRVHGYDAMCEVAEVPEGKRREASYGRLKQAVCAKCQCRVFQVWAALEYPDDLEEGDLGAGAKVEEWFSWFWLVTKCASCGEVQTVVDHECA